MFIRREWNCSRVLMIRVVLGCLRLLDDEFNAIQQILAVGIMWVYVSSVIDDGQTI